jgi:LSD1 subclass zinc finger protein
MIIAESVRCLSCRLMWMVPLKARTIRCPRCDHRMLKVFEIKFCQCSHENVSHEGFDNYGVIGQCTKCICPKFEWVRDSNWGFVEK